MNAPRTLLLATALASLGLAAACGARRQALPEDEEAPAGDTPDNTGATGTAGDVVDDGTCSLTRRGLTFEKTTPKGGACDTCMQTSCCAQTVACFDNNADCKALNECVLACRAAGDGGADGGGEGG